MNMKRKFKKNIKKIIKFRKKIKRKYFLNKINEDSLISDFKKFGIKPGMSIFVHSSLSNLGFIEGGAQTVINALMNVIGSQGTISMPGFIIRNSFSNSLEYLEKRDEPFDYKKEDPLVGAIPRCFFHNKNVLRSIHPTHSVLSWGKNAEYITSGHEDCASTFGIGSPLYKLIETGSFIMGLGSDLAHVTFYHVLEDTVKDFPIEVYGERLYIIKMLLSNGDIKEKKFAAHCDQEFRIEKLNSRWLRSYFRKYFTKKGGLINGQIGDSVSWIIKANNMYNCLSELLLKGYTIYTKPKNKLMRIIGPMLK